MNLFKTNHRIHGKLLLLSSFLFTFLIFSCQKEMTTDFENQFDEFVFSDISQFGNKKGKVDVCHITDNGDSHVININRNAWPDHEGHGDAIDNDGDGLFDRENGCSAVDCNDEDPKNLSSQYCGQIYAVDDSGEILGFNSYFIEVDGESCNISVTADYCFPNGITWELLETDGNTYTYYEYDPCFEDGCTVTIVNNGTSINVSFSCEYLPDEISLSGTLSEFEGEPVFAEYIVPVDNDGDGWYNTDFYTFGACAPDGYVSVEEFLQSYNYPDCNDFNPFVNPAAEEICDNVDNNCDETWYLPDVGLVNGNPAGTAAFGLLDATIIDAQWSNVEPALGCTGFFDPNPITTDLSGKVALIDRGACFFDTKAKYAEEKGAIAVIICNNDSDLIFMIPSGAVENPSIPVLSLGSEECAEIRSDLSGLISLEVRCEGEQVSERNTAQNMNELMMQEKDQIDKTADETPFNKPNSIKGLLKNGKFESHKAMQKILKYSNQSNIPVSEGYNQ